MKYSTSALFACAAATLPSALAHGFLQFFEVDGQHWNTFQYFNQDLSTPVRVTDYLLPNYNVYDRQIACGLNARKSTGIATVRPGSKIVWGWRTDFEKPWTHHEGWSRTFIGSCNGDCSSVDETTIEWFEISQKPQKADGGWPADELNKQQYWTEFFPGNVPSGDYLIRSELVAMHYSVQRSSTPPSDGHGWGMEWYPSCAAIRVVDGSGSIPNEIVRFPGAYNADDVGIYNPGLFSGNFRHTMPPLNKAQRTGSNPPAPPAEQPSNPSPPANNPPANNPPANNPPANNPPASNPPAAEQPSTPNPAPQTPSPSPEDDGPAPLCRKRRRVRRSEVPEGLGRRLSSSHHFRRASSPHH